MALSKLRDSCKIRPDERTKTVQKRREWVLCLERFYDTVSQRKSPRLSHGYRPTSLVLVMSYRSEQITPICVWSHKLLGGYDEIRISVVGLQFVFQVRGKELVHEAGSRSFLVIHDVSICEKTLRLLVKVEHRYILSDHAVYRDHDSEKVVVSCGHGRPTRPVEAGTHVGQVGHLNGFTISRVLYIQVIGAEKMGRLSEQLESCHKCGS